MRGQHLLQRAWLGRDSGATRHTPPNNVWAISAEGGTNPQPTLARWPLAIYAKLANTPSEQAVTPQPKRTQTTCCINRPTLAAFGPAPVSSPPKLGRHPPEPCQLRQEGQVSGRTLQHHSEIARRLPHNTGTTLASHNRLSGPHGLMKIREIPPRQFLLCGKLPYTTKNTTRHGAPSL